MPSTREIRRRIRGVKNIEKVTRAMNMIASARLRRSQQKAKSLRPYAERFHEIFQDVAAAGGLGSRHPLLEKRDVHRLGVVLVSSDRGLAGPFLFNITREVMRFIAQQRADVGLITIGSKGRDHFRSRGFAIDGHYPKSSRDVTLEEVSAITKRVITDFTSGRYDQVFLAYTQFVTALKSTPTVVQLLPIESEQNRKPPSPAPRSAYQFEPAADQLLGTLLPQYVEVFIYRALVESLTSEQAARMIAMKNATDSASDMIDHLTQEYNRRRQASITEEILSVVSGAEALKHDH